MPIVSRLRHSARNFMFSSRYDRPRRLPLFSDHVMARGDRRESIYLTPAKLPPADTEQQEDEDDSATSLMGISIALPTSRPLPQPIRVRQQQDQEEQDRSRGISI
jgi:hypothetical protein